MLTIKPSLLLLWLRSPTGSISLSADQSDLSILNYVLTSFHSNPLYKEVVFKSLSSMYGCYVYLNMDAINYP